MSTSHARPPIGHMNGVLLHLATLFAADMGSFRCAPELRPYSCAAVDCREALVTRAAARAAPHFLRTTAHLSYRVTGAFPSEMLALIGAIEATHATHLFESGTASGISTEMLASYFSDTQHPLAITTIDTGQLYSIAQNNATRSRLKRYANVECLLGDSRAEIPRLLDALPLGSRAIIFVDGPKGKAGRNLALEVLRHPRVVLVALHDTAPFWSSSFYDSLRAHPEHLLLTSDAPFRDAFGGLDELANVPGILKNAPRTGPASGDKGLADLVRYGNGLWVAGLSKLRSGPPVHIALGGDSKVVAGTLAVIRSTLSATVERSRLVFHVLVASSERALVEQQLHAVTGELHGATLDVIALEPRSAQAPASAARSSSDAAQLEQARFRLAELLPDTVRKVLYIDVDVLVLADPAIMVDAAFEGSQRSRAIAVTYRPKPLLRSLNLTASAAAALGLSALPPRAYSFNAGVMLLNLEVWRAAGLTQRVLDFASLLSHSGFGGLPGMSTPSDSQSVLCLFFQNASGRDHAAIERIPTQWNVDGLGWKLDRHDRHALCAARALHWSGPHKPWLPQAGRGKGPRSQYFHQLWRTLGGGAAPVDSSSTFASFMWGMYLSMQRIGGQVAKYVKKP